MCSKFNSIAQQLGACLMYSSSSWRRGRSRQRGIQTLAEFTTFQIEAPNAVTIRGTELNINCSSWMGRKTACMCACSIIFNDIMQCTSTCGWWHGQVISRLAWVLLNRPHVGNCWQLPSMFLDHSCFSCLTHLSVVLSLHSTCYVTNTQMTHSYIHPLIFRSTTCRQLVELVLMQSPDNNVDNNLLLNPSTTEALVTGIRQQGAKFENSSRRF